MCGPSLDFTKLNSTYSLVQVDRVFARDDVSDGAAGGLAGRLLAAALAYVGHFCNGEGAVSRCIVRRDCSGESNCGMLVIATLKREIGAYRMIPR